MTLPASTKKEIRLKVENKFYRLLQVNANQYGIKPSDYIIHLILDDLKTGKPAFVNDEVEKNLSESYDEIAVAKKNGTFQGKSVQHIIQKII